MTTETTAPTLHAPAALPETAQPRRLALYYTHNPHGLAHLLSADIAAGKGIPTEIEKIGAGGYRIQIADYRPRIHRDEQPAAAAPAFIDFLPIANNFALRQFVTYTERHDQPKRTGFVAEIGQTSGGRYSLRIVDAYDQLGQAEAGRWFADDQLALYG